MEKSPEKILPFEITLEDSKNSAENYLIKSSYEYKEDLINNLKPIYLPYGMYSFECEAETIEVTPSSSRHRGGIDYTSHTAKFLCDIFTISTKRFEDSYIKEIDKTFKLSKLEDFNNSILDGYETEKIDLGYNELKESFDDKLKNEILINELDFLSIEKTKIMNDRFSYIYLPFYYSEVGEAKLLINGQNGQSITNSDDFIKSENRLKVERIIKGEKVQKNLGKFAGYVVVILFVILFFIGRINELLIKNNPEFGLIAKNFTLLVCLVGLFIICLKFNQKNINKYNYIRDIKYNKREKIKDIREIRTDVEENISLAASKLNFYIDFAIDFFMILIIYPVIIGFKNFHEGLQTNQPMNSNILNLGLALICLGVFIYILSIKFSSKNKNNSH